MFGRLLIAAKCRDIDVKEVLRYELSTVPFVLAHADGALRKTTKSVEVERECQAQGRLPEKALSTAFIFDAMALVQTFKSAGSRTFKDLAERFFNVLFTPLRQGQCRRVDVVFDRCDVQESIKESERVRRGLSRALEIQITASIHQFQSHGGSLSATRITRLTFPDFFAESGAVWVNTTYFLIKSW